MRMLVLTLLTFKKVKLILDTLYTNIYEFWGCMPPYLRKFCLLPPENA